MDPTRVKLDIGKWNMVNVKEKKRVQVLPSAEVIWGRRIDARGRLKKKREEREDGRNKSCFLT